MENNTNETISDITEKKNNIRKREYHKTQKNDKTSKKIVGSNFIDLELEGTSEKKGRK